MARKRVLSMLVLLAAVVTDAWAETITVYWHSYDTYVNNNSKDGVVLEGDYVTEDEGVKYLGYENESGTFTTNLGNFTNIEITGGWLATNFGGTGWSGRTWTGNSSRVEFIGYLTDNYSAWTITFTIDSPAHTVAMKESTEDIGNWTILPTEAAGNTTVTATYNGSKHVKSVKAVKKAEAPSEPAGNIIDLSTLEENYVAQNDVVLTGTLGANVKISIADGATVTLDNASINADGNSSSDNKYAGITCLGNATIILKDGTANTVRGFYGEYPGIFVAMGYTLTIQGSGSLTASPPFNGIANSFGAGIGGGFLINCGNIEILGGTITATGGFGCAGIGGSKGYDNNNINIITTCGTITIKGGTITATGGDYAAGIGGGQYCNCGDITITSDVTSVTATKGKNAPNSIGAGKNGSCTSVSIEDESKVTQN